tara:strand:+ start:14560 stop:15813 length:1254 start_codon:yes stop_codon:yes gene_type:complete
MKLIVKNISELIQTEKISKKWAAGKQMSNINTIKDAFIECENGIITSFGSMKDWKGIEDWNNIEIVDAEDGTVFPTYCDSHTHLVFAESREKEFVGRINGLSYQEIAENGGGILNSANKIREISEEELYYLSKKRLNEIISTGTGAIEIKSGYGLSLESELKILRVINKLKNEYDILIKSTFLGAHAIPKEFINNKSKYIDLIINDMLPKFAEDNLIDFVDVFCEKNYFSVDDTIKILKAANKYGIKGKTHVNQFNSIGGVKASIEAGALSVDHLEEMKEEDFEALKNSQCMPTALPTCSFFLGIKYSPAKEIISRGLPLALASDYNPGSSPSGSMNFVSSLGCIKLKMTPEQVINATTINSAYAMGAEKELGSICVGKKANFFITKKIPSYSYLHYNFGGNLIKKVFIKGKLFVSK